MSVARQSAVTLATMATRVRLETGDKSAQTKLQEFSTAEIYQAINDALVQLQTKQNRPHAGRALTSTTVTYSSTSGANLSTNLYDDVEQEEIVAVEDYTTTTAPIALPFMPLEIAERYAADPAYVPTGRCYTLIASATHRMILVKPHPTSGLTLRVWYIAAAFVVSEAADQLPFQTRWAELVGLVAAKALLSIDNQWTSQQEERRLELMKLFEESLNQKRGFRALPKRRLGRS